MVEMSVRFKKFGSYLPKFWGIKLEVKLNFWGLKRYKKGGKRNLLFD
jgi:hypothetical protein